MFLFALVKKVILKKKKRPHLSPFNLNNFLSNTEDNFIKTLTSNSESYIILTASMNDTNPSHVNCKPRDHWIGRIEKEGFNYDEKLYQELLKHSTMEKRFIKHTGMIFKRI